MFQILEAKYGGGLRALATEGKVLQVPSVTREALEALLSHRVCAVHVPGFYPAAAAQAMSDRLQASAARKNWMVSTARGLESSDVESVSGGRSVVDVVW